MSSELKILGEEKMIHGYPKVFNLGHKAIVNLFADPVLVEEKVDGSQFSFVFDETGTLHCRSHHNDLDLDDPDKMFRQAIEVVRELSPELHPGWIYRGEYLSKPKHNTLAYDRVPKHNIVIFDIETAPQCFLPHSVKMLETQRLDLECVPWLSEDVYESWDALKELLDRPSFLGGQKVEGIVIKNYEKISILTGHVLMGKYVSEAFKEIHKKDWKDRNPAGRDIKQKITDALRTEARWNKAIQHLEERGELENDPRDIGPLLKEINKDVLAECKDEILEMLFRWGWKDISCGITRGFPEWYKERLAQGAFK